MHAVVGRSDLKWGKAVQELLLCAEEVFLFGSSAYTHTHTHSNRDAF